MIGHPFSLEVNANHQRGEVRREAARARAAHEARLLGSSARSDDRQAVSRGVWPVAMAKRVSGGLGLLVQGWATVLRGRPAA